MHYRVHQDAVPLAGAAFTPGQIHEYAMHRPEQEAKARTVVGSAATLGGPWAATAAALGVTVEQLLSAHLATPLSAQVLKEHPEALAGVKKEDNTGVFTDLGLRSTEEYRAEAHSLEGARVAVGMVAGGTKVGWDGATHVVDEGLQAILPPYKGLRQPQIEEERVYQDSYQKIEAAIRRERAEAGKDNWDRELQ